MSTDSAAADSANALVGPFPVGTESDEDKVAYDRLRRRVMWAMPYGLYILGSSDGARRRNGMTINWVSQLSADPKLIGAGVEKAAFTHELIEAGECFSLCLVAREDRAIVRKFTKPVDVDLEARTLNGFEYTELVSGAPVLTQSVGYLDCALHSTVDLGTHSLFIGEVLDAGFFRDEDTPVLRMEDTRMNYGG